jgi:hypothetical protein
MYGMHFVGNVTEQAVYDDITDYDKFADSYSRILDKIIETRVRFVNIALHDIPLIRNVAKYFYNKGLRRTDFHFAVAVPIELIMEGVDEDESWVELFDYSFIMYRPLGSREGRHQFREKYVAAHGKQPIDLGSF